MGWSGRRPAAIPETMAIAAREIIGATEALPSAFRLPDEIRRLKRERGAVLLAHYYQESEIQDLADHLGDSLQLAQAARKTDAPVIAFAGVHFMAETAKIVNPDRTVVLPDQDA